MKSFVNEPLHVCEFEKAIITWRGSESTNLHILGERDSCVDHSIYNFGVGKNMHNAPQILICNRSLVLKRPQEDC